MKKKKKKVKLKDWKEYVFSGYIIGASCDIQLEGCIAKTEENKKLERFKLYKLGSSIEITCCLHCLNIMDMLLKKVNR